MYLKEWAVPLLTAEAKELAKRIEAGDEMKRRRLAEVNLINVSIAKRHVGRGMLFQILFKRVT